MRPDFWLQESQSKGVGQSSISDVKLKWAREWNAGGLKHKGCGVRDTFIGVIPWIAKVIHLPSLLYWDIVSLSTPYWALTGRSEIAK
jgi:hypothetical protein